MQINFIKQFKQYGVIILILILLLNLMLLAAWGISAIYSLPLGSLLEDPPSIFGYNQFIGFTTYMGVIVLSAGMGAAILLSLFRPQTNKKKASQVVIGLALITLFLIIDDLFLLHERVFTGLLQVGERRIFLIYMSLFAVFLYIFRKELVDNSFIFFLVSIMLFALSLAADLLSDKISLPAAMADTVEILEEGSKLGGYLFWSANIILKTRDLILPEGQAKD